MQKQSKSPTRSSVSLVHFFESLKVRLPKSSAQRAVTLWRDKLLEGQHLDPEKALGKPLAVQQQGPILLTHLDLHLVCPHHLTVAFGKAHVAYEAQHTSVGLGAISKLVMTATARLTLQEDATDLIAKTIFEVLQPDAAVVCIHAIHPCHRLTTPRAHQAELITWSSYGNTTHAKNLKQLILSQTQRASA